MNKSIYELQNEKDIQKCIIIQKNYYTKAKAFNNFIFIFNVVIIVLFSILSLLSETMKAISILISMIIPYINNIFEKEKSKIQKEASDVQQYIDTYLYSAVLNEESKYRNQKEWNNTLKKSEMDKLVSKCDEMKENWYSDYSQKKDVEQIYLSQKENINWDNNLRNNYLKLNYVSFFILLIAIFIVVILFNLTFVKSMLYFAWLLVIINYFQKNISMLKNDIKNQEIMKEIAIIIENNFEKENFKIEDILELEIKLQDKIYRHRKTAYLIPDWFYKF